MVSHVVILFSASFVCGHRCLPGEESGKAPPAGAEAKAEEAEAPERRAWRLPLLPPAARLASPESFPQRCIFQEWKQRPRLRQKARRRFVRSLSRCPSLDWKKEQPRKLFTLASSRWAQSYEPCKQLLVHRFSRVAAVPENGNQSLIDLYIEILYAIS